MLLIMFITYIFIFNSLKKMLHSVSKFFGFICVSNYLIHYRKYSETFRKFSGIRGNVVLINPSVALEYIRYFEVSKYKEYFLNS